MEKKNRYAGAMLIRRIKKQLPNALETPEKQFEDPEWDPVPPRQRKPR